MVLEHPGEQLVGRLARLQVEPLLVLVHGQHQARLQLQQRRDQHEELGGRLEVELARALEVLDVGEHHLGQVDLEQVDLLLEDQRQQQVERPLEDLEVEVEIDYGHRTQPRAGGPTPMAARTSSITPVAIARARSAPSLEHGLERGLVRAQLEVALADRGQQVHHGLPHGAP